MNIAKPFNIDELIEDYVKFLFETETLDILKEFQKKAPNIPVVSKERR